MATIRKGPTTKVTTAVALGYAQVRIGLSATNIASVEPVLTSTNSIGALANTKFTSEVDLYKHLSGFPEQEDLTIVLRERAIMELTVEEITPFNIALAMGEDPVTYSGEQTGFGAHSGELKLGAMSIPDYVRMEALYTYPNGTNTMTIVFPRGQVASPTELDFQREDSLKSPIRIESKTADSGAPDSAGNAAWDAKPLGYIRWR